MHNYKPSIEALIETAKEAGRAIMNVYETDFTVQEKDDQSPLTAADLAAHHLIIGSLSQLTPDIPVLSEESSDITLEQRRNWSRYWLIDPLDGTREFVNRNGEFTVNIALIEDGQPTVGIVYVPVTGVIYYGDREVGALRQLPGAEREQISVCSKKRHPIKVAGSRSHAGDGLKSYLTNLGEHEVISMGSSLKICLIAEGSADIYPRIGPTSEWDTAAAQAIVEAAGGRVTDTQMRPLRYNSKDSLLNPHFFVFGDLETNWSQYL